MKRLYTMLGLVLLLAVLVLPAGAQAGGHGAVPAGWTWDET